MQTPKPFAALSSTLLARKGQAKPAMRPQGFGTLTSHEDLGWNDMGHNAYRPVVATEMPPPAVVMQQDALSESFEPQLPELEPELEPEMPAPQPKAEANGKEARAKPLAEVVAKAKADVMPISRAQTARGARAKAAFTLRLDPERHLRLRLACAVDHRSAQQIVTQALDSFLAAMPELDALAGKVRTKQ